MPFLAQIPAWVMTAATMAGTAVSAGGTLMRGLSQAQAMRDQGAASKRNAEVSRQSAQAIREAGEYEAKKVRSQGSRLLSQQQAMYGATGLEFEGSPLLVMEETAANIEREALAAKYGFEIKARRAEAEAEQYDYMGERAGRLAGNAIWQGVMGAGTSLLTGFGSMGKGGWGGGGAGGGLEYDWTKPRSFWNWRGGQD